MVRHGTAPFLECSSKGDRRFSAFYAKIKARDNRSIEEIYQGAKLFDLPVFDRGEMRRSGLSWAAAKGRLAINQDEVTKLYAQLWDEYIAENPDLVPVLTAASGLSDLFGKEGSCCQATELWRIRCAALESSHAP